MLHCQCPNQRIFPPSKQLLWVLGHMYVVSRPNNVALLNSRQTAALGLFNGLKIKLPDLENLPEEKSEDESEPGSKSPPLEKENEKDREVASQDDEPPNIEVDAVKVENTAPKPNDDASEESTPTATVPRRKTEGWVVVLGGASSVGKYAIQVTHPQPPQDPNRHAKPCPSSPE